MRAKNRKNDEIWPTFSYLMRQIRKNGSGKQGREGEIIASECGPFSQFFLYLCALELPPAAVLASAILYLGKNQLEIEYEF